VPLGTVHINRMLTNVSIGLVDQQFISEQVYLPLPVDKQSDLYEIYDGMQYNAFDDTRAPGTEAKRGPSWRISTQPFYCGGHARKDGVPAEKNANQDPPLNLTMDTTTILKRQIMLRQELNLVTQITADMAAAQTVNLGAGGLNVPWNNNANDPVALIRTKMDAIGQACGVRPNVLAIGQPLWTSVRQNTKVTGLITGAPQLPNARVTPAQFAELCELDEILIGRAVYNTANAGQPASLSYVWGANAVLFVRPPAPGLRTLALGYQPQWTKALGTMAGLEQVPGIDGIGNEFVEQYWWQPTKEWIIEAHKYYAQTTVAATAGLIFTNGNG
jgi:hypothetical protein